jgi:hypothetical protein
MVKPQRNSFDPYRLRRSLGDGRLGELRLHKLQPISKGIGDVESRKPTTDGRPAF